jgi:uncharacterized protein YegL
MRRLPIYIVIDTSGSMNGEPIASVNVGLQAMVHALRQDPHALDSVYLSLITFDNQVKEIFPLTPLDQVQIPEVTCPQSGATYLGAALELVIQSIEKNVQRSSAEQKGDWRPMLFIMTDGAPSDIACFNDMVLKIRRGQFGKIIACAAGPKAKEAFLKQITDTVVSLDTTDSAAFASFFKWVSASVEQSSSTAGSYSVNTPLPPPPTEIQVVI